MIITSQAFADGEMIPAKYACEGQNVSPPLAFGDLPPGTQSLVLIVEDPDAPAKPWVHWLVFDIPPTTAGALAGEVPEGGTEGRANGGTPGYEGPCPPSGKHRYFFKLYALDKQLDLPASVDRAAVLKAMEGHILDRSELMGVYQQGSV